MSKEQSPEKQYSGVILWLGVAFISLMAILVFSLILAVKAFTLTPESSLITDNASLRLIATTTKADYRLEDVLTIVPDKIFEYLMPEDINNAKVNHAINKKVKDFKYLYNFKIDQSFILPVCYFNPSTLEFYSKPLLIEVMEPDDDQPYINRTNETHKVIIKIGHWKRNENSLADLATFDHLNVDVLYNMLAFLTKSEVHRLKTLNKETKKNIEDFLSFYKWKPNVPKLDYELIMPNDSDSDDERPITQNFTLSNYLDDYDDFSPPIEVNGVTAFEGRFQINIPRRFPLRRSTEHFRLLSAPAKYNWELEGKIENNALARGSMFSEKPEQDIIMRLDSRTKNEWLRDEQEHLSTNDELDTILLDMIYTEFINRNYKTTKLASAAHEYDIDTGTLYMHPHDANSSQAFLHEDGLFRDIHGELVNTKWTRYVLSDRQQFFLESLYRKHCKVNEREDGVFGYIKHSSFTCGGGVISNGYARIIDGKLERIMFYSGHYLISDEHQLQFFKWMIEQRYPSFEDVRFNYWDDDKIRKATDLNVIKYYELTKKSS